jgi:uncharacterized protein (DUF58 family)
MLRPTRAGWVFFGLTFGVGFAALNTGNNLLYLVLSLMLAFLVLSGVLSESALRGITVERRLPGEVFANASHLVALDITNAQHRVPAFALVVEDLAEAPEESDARVPLGRAFVLRTAPRTTERRFYRLQWPRRGSLRLRGFRVSTRYPFGLFSKSLELTKPAEALVYPGLDRAEVATVRHSEEEGLATVATPTPGSEISGLRDFRAGDPLRRIHWRASLRRGSLVVREREGEHRAEQEVRLRTQGAQPGPVFEAAVRRAASETVALLDAGACVALSTDSHRFAAADGPAQRARLLSFLARVAPDTAP